MTRTVLIVDDEEDCALHLKEGLETTGHYTVAVCTDSRQAVSDIKRLQPSVVLLDILMPGFNGLEVAKQLAGDPATREVPLIFLTAAVGLSDGDQQLFSRHRCLTKPIQVQELVSAIERAGRKGFTLIELMLVIVIIAALAAMVVPRLAGRSEEARVGIAKADIGGNVTLALRLYEVDNGRYPTTEQGLKALVQKPVSSPLPSNWKGPYLEQVSVDPWGRSYAYRYPGTHPPRDYDLLSLGSDGVESADDITNW